MPVIENDVLKVTIDPRSDQKTYEVKGPSAKHVGTGDLCVLCGVTT